MVGKGEKSSTARWMSVPGPCDAVINLGAESGRLDKPRIFWQFRALVQLLLQLICLISLITDRFLLLCALLRLIPHTQCLVFFQPARRWLGLLPAFGFCLTRPHRPQGTKSFATRELERVQVPFSSFQMLVFLFRTAFSMALRGHIQLDPEVDKEVGDFLASVLASSTRRVML